MIPEKPPEIHPHKLDLWRMVPSPDHRLGSNTNAEIQRCQVHIARNVLAKVPKKFKKDVADSLRDIFYVSSREKAASYLKTLREKWFKIVPSAV